MANEVKEYDICENFGMRLGALKKRANVSFAKMHYGTRISENHIKKTVKGQVNAGLKQIELYSKFFGLKHYEFLQYDAPLPSRILLQQNISNFFKSQKFIESATFKKVGPSYILEEFILESKSLQTPMESVQITKALNEKNETKYKTNDVSRVLDKFAKEGLLKKIDTGNKRRPKYQLVDN